MASPAVYSPTTESDPKTSWCLVPSENLDFLRFWVKVAQVVLSFFAFILEEVVNSCISCTALYFFEFLSCTAFLFTLLLLILLSTSLHTRVGISCWGTLDFCYTAGVSFFFLVASIVFAADNGKTTVETTAVAFGFLACVAFLVDLFLQYRSRGFPCGGGEGKAEPSNGGVAAPVAASAETEKLNANGTEDV